MSQPELLTTAIAFLNEHEIEYMVTGSVVSSLQGEPRTTHDVDIVVNISAKDVASLLKQFPFPDYYLSEEAIKDAIQRKSMFNLLDTKTSDKVDFWVLTDSPFDRSRFDRRYREDIPGLPMFVSTPEDTILMKLYWCELSGGSAKQFYDALRVYELQYSILDLSYINYWVDQLKLLTVWEKLKADAKPVL